MSISKLKTWAALSCTAALVSACLDTTLDDLPPLKSDAGAGEVVGEAGAGTDGEPGSGEGEPLAPIASLVGVAGGSVMVDGLAEVAVPPSALIEDRELRAREIPAEQLPVALPLNIRARTVELTPHGQLFDLPITIKLAYDASANPAELLVMRLDDATDLDWEIVPGATFAEGVATFESTTFSYYTVVTFPEATCTVPAAVAACAGACTADQYCSTANVCTAIPQTTLCANSRIYAVHGGEPTVDNPGAESMAAAFASHCSNVSMITSKDDPAIVQSCSSELLVGSGNTMFLAGGPFTQPVLRYLDRRISPVFLDTNGTQQQFNTRAGTTLFQFDPATISPSHDYFLIQIFPDTARGALVVSAFGREGPGTRAAVWYFNYVVVPTMHTNTRSWNKYLIVEWQDSGDLAPDSSDTWTVRVSDPLPPPPPPPPVEPPPPTTETPYQAGANGTLSTGVSVNAAAGYKFTPQVSGRITALGGFFNGTKTVKLFRGSTVLATASVTAANNWVYRDITPVSVTAGTQYTVAVYLAGSGGARRTSGTALPRTIGNVRIDVPTQATTSIFSPNAVPTTNSSPTTTMLGLADVKFIRN